MTSIRVCAGPDPETMPACYGSCHEWCYLPHWCANAPASLPDAVVGDIREFQRQAGLRPLVEPSRATAVDGTGRAVRSSPTEPSGDDLPHGHGPATPTRPDPAGGGLA